MFEADHQRRDLVVARIGHLHAREGIDGVQLHQARIERSRLLGLSPGFFHVVAGARAGGNAVEAGDLNLGRTQVLRVRHGDQRRTVVAGRGRFDSRGARGCRSGQSRGRRRQRGGFRGSGPTRARPSGRGAGLGVGTPVSSFAPSSGKALPSAKRTGPGRAGPAGRWSSAVLWPMSAAEAEKVPNTRPMREKLRTTRIS